MIQCLHLWCSHVFKTTPFSSRFFFGDFSSLGCLSRSSLTHRSTFYFLSFFFFFLILASTAPRSFLEVHSLLLFTLVLSFQRVIFEQHLRQFSLGWLRSGPREILHLLKPRIMRKQFLNSLGGPLKHWASGLKWETKDPIDYLERRSVHNSMLATFSRNLHLQQSPLFSPSTWVSGCKSFGTLSGTLPLRECYIILLYFTLECGL